MARGAGYAAFLGAVLIGVAVIIGIVLLQIGDNNDNGPASASPTEELDHHDTAPHEHHGAHGRHDADHGETLARSGEPHRAQRRRGDRQGQRHEHRAGGQGLHEPGEPNDWTGHTQTGNTVYCRAGLDREGAALAVAVGTVAGGSTAVFHTPLPAPPPPFSTGHDCVVVVGGK